VGCIISYNSSQRPKGTHEKFPAKRPYEKRIMDGVIEWISVIFVKIHTKICRIIFYVYIVLVHIDTAPRVQNRQTHRSEADTVTSAYI